VVRTTIRVIQSRQYQENVVCVVISRVGEVDIRNRGWEISSFIGISLKGREIGHLRQAKQYKDKMA
jgi:hypothetical protein